MLVPAFFASYQKSETGDKEVVDVKTFEIRENAKWKR